MKLKNIFITKGRRVTEKGKYIVMTFYAIIPIIVGLIIGSPQGLINGLINIIVEPDLLISDYIGVGGLGSALINSGLTTLFSIFLLYRFNMPITGVSVAAIWLVSGFSFFGKNIFNFWIILSGVWLYAKYQREKFQKYIYIGLLSSSLSPIVTFLTFRINFPIYINLTIGILVGLFIGFIMPPLASYMLRVHQGFNLYNIGFTAGVVGTVFISIARSYGISIEERFIWSNGYNKILAIYLFYLFLSMLLFGFLLNKFSFKGLANIYDYPGRLVTDFIILEGFGATLLNMGINGIVVTSYVLLIGGELNGAVIAGIFTVVGHSSFGKHLKNIIPILLGVIIGSMTKIWSINEPEIVLAALFGTTLAPIAGEFGWGYGILAGFIHSSVVLNVGYLHGGFNLYNNGFAGGIVAATLVPIIEAFREDT